MEPFRTIIEPFRIHAVEPIRMTTRDERLAAIEVVRRVADRPTELRGLRMVQPGPPSLRHFTARFEPLA